MHTLASKSTSRDRDLSPRYYYKLSEKISCLKRLKNFIRVFVTFMFTQVGVIVLIATYMLCGAAMFQNIEEDSQMEVAVTAQLTRHNYTSHIWCVTDKYNVLRPVIWRGQVAELIVEFQEEVVENVRQGYTGNNPGVRVWTFSSSLMFSLSIFTTIGYGNLAPKTVMGKVVTILYALLGIPLMFIYMANIGSILATSFKYLYSKLCRCEAKPTDLPKKATLPSIREDTLSYLDEEFVGRGSISSYSRVSRENSFRTASNGAKRERPNVLKRFHKTKQEEEAQPKKQTEASKETSFLERMTSKSSRKSGMSVSNMEEVVKFKLVEDLSLVTIPITTCLLVLISYIVFGAALFSVWEGWSILDGAYFCFTSLMTIGFGDFVPGNSYIYNVADNMSNKEAHAKLVLLAIYLLLGMAIIGMCLNLMQEKISTQIRLLARTLGLLREFGDEDDI